MANDCPSGNRTPLPSMIAEEKCSAPEGSLVIQRHNNRSVSEEWFRFRRQGSPVRTDTYIMLLNREKGVSEVPIIGFPRPRPPAAGPAESPESFGCVARFLPKDLGGCNDWSGCPRCAIAASFACSAGGIGVAADALGSRNGFPTCADGVVERGGTARAVLTGEGGESDMALVNVGHATEYRPRTR
jgi:hypothetical protein